MRRNFLFVSLVLIMTFGLINVDLGQLFTNPSEVISLSPDTAEARRGGGGGRSSRRAPSRRAAPSARKATPSRPKPASATARPSKPKPSTAAGVGAGVKPKATTARRDAATKSASRQQSQVKATTAKSTLRTSNGKTMKVAGTPAAKSVRGMSSSRYNSRSTRRDSAFNSRRGMETPAQRTTIINNYGGSRFGDPYSGLFMFSLMGMSIHNQGLYHYNHWDRYSAMRQQQLMSENAQLRAEMSAMTGPRNANYAPEGTDPDLMYSNEFVNAAYNPAPVAPEKKGFPVFWTVVGLSVVGFGSYFAFFRRTTS